MKRHIREQIAAVLGNPLPPEHKWTARRKRYQATCCQCGDLEKCRKCRNREQARNLLRRKKGQPMVFIPPSKLPEALPLSERPQEERIYSQTRRARYMREWRARRAEQAEDENHMESLEMAFRQRGNRYTENREHLICW